jgi:hypothetical protein
VRPRAALLRLERFEDRVVPSSSIPLNATTWTHIGPAPDTFSQAPGGPDATGRVNGVAVDPVDPNTIFVASDSGGIWRSTDGGQTWSPRTDQSQMYWQTITAVHRASGDTVYAADQLGKLWISKDNGTTFTQTSPFPDGSAVNKLTVFQVDPNDQTKDVILAAVGTIYGVPPAVAITMQQPAPRVPGSGIWRSMDGGATWKNIVDSTVAPFTIDPSKQIPVNALSFSDVVINPANANIIYAAVGNANGDPTNGVYRTNNALAATPTWTLLIGGAAFVPGETPGNIKLAISPVVTSEVFASLALRRDPGTGFSPMLGVFRTEDSGANWVPVLLPNPANPINDIANFMGIYGYDNNVVGVAPNSPTNPDQQVVYLAGFGLPQTNPAGTVLRSTNSGDNWTEIGIGSNGIGTYPNVHQGNFDSQGRLVLATGGGVYRLDSTKPITWSSINGTPGPNALDVSQFNGFAISPNDPNQAVGSVAWEGDLPNSVLYNLGTPPYHVRANVGPIMHDAVMFSDLGNGNPAYGWQTVDANGFDTNFGSGPVLYNPFTPNIVYRTTLDNGAGNFIRGSSDGGQTWVPLTSGFEADPFGRFTPTMTIDPSQPNRLFSGFINVQDSDNYGNNWGETLLYGASGQTNQIPHLPTSKNGQIPITAIGVGRIGGVDFNGKGINGVTLFVGTTDDVKHDPTTPDDDATGTAANLGPQLFVNLIPTNTAWPLGGANGSVWDEHSWANITPSDPVTKKSLFTGNVMQVIVDPANNTNLYVFLDNGQVWRATNFKFSYAVDTNTGVIFGGAPDKNPVTGAGTPLQTGTATWTNISGNLPASAWPVPLPAKVTPPVDYHVLGMALDSHVLNNSTDDVLYGASSGQGVWKLTNPGQTFTAQNPPKWVQIGLDPNNGNTPSIPAAPVTALSLNTTTGILGASTYGRGVYEMQIRGLISGHVFTDSNGNGVRDAGEPILANTTVELLDQNQGGTVVAATTTDATGFYEFRSVTAGNYKVVAVVSGVTLIQTTGEPADLSNATEATNDTVDIGLFKPCTIIGTVFNDLNNNALRDGGEPGLGGLQVFIDFNGNGTFDSGETVVPTAADGSFSFTNLGPAVIGGAPNPQTVNGAYLVRFVPTTGFVQTTPNLAPITLATGQNVTNKLIGVIRTGAISGTAFVDTNGDGARQPGEPGLGGATIVLNGPGGTRTLNTANDGTYTFFSLATGSYTVTETLPPGYVQTTTSPGPVTLQTTTQATGVDFGDFKLVTLGGTVFTDVNGNGTMDAGDGGLSGVTFDLVNAATNQVVNTTVSGAGGVFAFTFVGPLPGGGQYLIREELPTGYVQTTPTPAAFAPSSGTDQTGFKFGNFQGYSVSGTAYLDANGDGAMDNGEVGSSGFVIQLKDTGGNVVLSTTSQADGSFTLSGIGPGALTLVEAPRPGYTIKQGAAGYAINGSSGATIVGLQFGNVRIGVIAGTAFVDQNGNGIEDAGDLGTGGFSIQLSGPLDAFGQGPSQTVPVGADGSYSFFNLAPGNYAVTELSRTGWVLTTPATVNISLSSSSNLPDINFGNFKLVTLSGLAFNDQNKSGSFDVGEPGIPGLTFDLINASSGQTVAKAVSDSTGTFSFANVGPIPPLAGSVVPGSYLIREEPPIGAVQTTPNPAGVSPNSGTDINTFQFGNSFVIRTIVTAADVGGPPTVTVRNATTGAILRSFDAYGRTFVGGVRVATGAIRSGLSSPDIVTGAGPGGGPHVKVFNGTDGSVMASFFAFPAAFTGGVYVAIGDVNGDGIGDVIVSADAGGGPQVKVFDGAGIVHGQVNVIANFYAFPSAFTGGVRVAAADIDKDGSADIITGAGAGGGPQVKVFSGKTLLANPLNPNAAVIRNFYAYSSGFTGGVFVAAGDVKGNGQPDIITGAGSGGPHLRVFDGSTGVGGTQPTLIGETFAFPATLGFTTWTSGLRVATTDVNNDGKADIIVSPGPGQKSYLRVLDGLTFAEVLPGGEQTVFEPGFLGGVFVAGN